MRTAVGGLCEPINDGDCNKGGVCQWAVSGWTPVAVREHCNDSTVMDIQVDDAEQSVTKRRRRDLISPAGAASCSNTPCQMLAGQRHLSRFGPRLFYAVSDGLTHGQRPIHASVTHKSRGRSKPLNWAPLRAGLTENSSVCPPVFDPTAGLRSRRLPQGLRHRAASC